MLLARRVHVALALCGRRSNSRSAPATADVRFGVAASPRACSGPVADGPSEDALFVAAAAPSGGASFLGLADGVGSWHERGVDPRLYATRLMEAAAAAAALRSSGSGGGSSGGEDGDDRDSAFAVLDASWRLAAASGVVGSATAVVAALDAGRGRVRICAVGDSEALVLRRPGGPTRGPWRVEARTSPQQAAFNRPFQLGHAGGASAAQEALFQTPRDAARCEWLVRPGDVLLLYSDGLSDNMDEAQLLASVGEWSAAPTAALDAGDLALLLVRRARELSLDKTRDGPFARAAKDHDIMWGGGRPDDVTVIAAMLMEPAASPRPPVAASDVRVRSLGPRWDALVPRNSAVPAARRSFSTAASAGGRVARVMLGVADVAMAAAFYVEALRLKQRPRGGSDDGSLAVLGAGDAGSCCDVFLKRTPARGGELDAGNKDVADSLPPPPPQLRFPYLTFGVSNLKTSARHAVRKQGGATDAADAAGVLDASCMLFADPGGRGMRVLHLFRRNPAISLTLGVASLDAARAFYVGLLRMRELAPAEALGALRLPPGERSTAVLAYGDAHNSTMLVLEELSAAASAALDLDAPLSVAATVLGVEVPAAALPALHAHVAAAGLEVAPAAFAAEHRSFVCVDRDGNVVHVSAS